MTVGEDGLIALCNCDVPSKIILFDYERLEKKLDQLPRDEIEAMWEYVGANFPNKSREEKINASKIIHWVGERLKQQNA